MSRPNPTPNPPSSRLPVPVARSNPAGTPTAAAAPRPGATARPGTSSAAPVGGRANPSSSGTPSSITGSEDQVNASRTTNLTNPAPVSAARLAWNSAGQRFPWMKVAVYEATQIENFRVDTFLDQAFMIIPSRGEPAAIYHTKIPEVYKMHTAVFADLVEGRNLFKQGKKGLCNLGRVWDKYFQGEVALIGTWVTHWITIGRDKWYKDLQKIVDHFERGGYQPSVRVPTDRVALALLGRFAARNARQPVAPTTSGPIDTNTDSGTSYLSADPSDTSLISNNSTVPLPACTESNHSIVSLVNRNCCHHILSCIKCNLVIAAGDDGKPAAAGFLTEDKQLINVVNLTGLDDGDDGDVKMLEEDEGIREIQEVDEDEQAHRMDVDEEEDPVVGKGKGRNLKDGPGFETTPTTATAAGSSSSNTSNPAASSSNTSNFSASSSKTFDPTASILTLPPADPENSLASLAKDLFQIGSYSSIFEASKSGSSVASAGGASKGSAVENDGQEEKVVGEELATTSSAISFGRESKENDSSDVTTPGSRAQVVEEDTISAGSDEPFDPGHTGRSGSLPGSTPSLAAPVSDQASAYTEPVEATSDANHSRAAPPQSFGTALVYPPTKSTKETIPSIVIDKSRIQSSDSSHAETFGHNMFGTMPSLSLGMTSSTATQDVASLAKQSEGMVHSGVDKRLVDPSASTRAASAGNPRASYSPRSQASTEVLPLPTLSGKRSHKPLPVTPTTPQIPALGSFSASLSIPGLGGQRGVGGSKATEAVGDTEEKVGPPAAQDAPITTQSISATSILESIIGKDRMSQLYEEMYPRDDSDGDECEERRVDIAGLMNLMEQAFISNDPFLKYKIRAVSMHISGQMGSKGYIGFRWNDLNNIAQAAKEELEAEHVYRKGKGLSMPFAAWEDAVMTVHADTEAKRLPKTRGERDFATKQRREAAQSAGSGGVGTGAAPGGTTSGASVKRQRSDDSLAEGAGPQAPVTKSARTNNNSTANPPRRSVDASMRSRLRRRREHSQADSAVWKAASNGLGSCCFECERVRWGRDFEKQQVQGQHERGIWCGQDSQKHGQKQGQEGWG